VVSTSIQGASTDTRSKASRCREILEITPARRVSVDSAHRVVLPSLHDPPESYIGGDQAVHDPQVRKTAQRLKAWPPDMILKRGLSDGCDARPQQQLQEAEENRQRPQHQLITWRWHETGTGMGHAFLDLVPADRWAAKSPCDTMRQRGLPGADRAADNHKSRYRCHQQV
jgi:hypothetical protein